MWSNFNDSGAWICGGMLFGSLICGALASMWLNSIDARTATAHSPNLLAPPTIEHTVRADGMAAEVIGVGLDKNRMKYIRTAN